MKYTLFCSFIFLLVLAAKGQVNPIKLKPIKALNEDVVDIQLQNPSDETLYILRIDTDPNVTSRIFSKQIPPRRNVPLRLKLNPKKKGNLTEKVRLYLSNHEDPIELELSAKVLQVPPNDRQSCPSFGGGGGFKLNPKTGVYEREDTGEFQKVNLNVANPSVVEVNNEELEEESLAIEQVENKSSKAIEVERKKRLSPEERRNQPSLLEKLFGNTDSTAKTETVVQKEIETTANQESNESLLGSEYKPNNIVFLIDASTSMREGNKMALLQETMIELLKPLRAQDYLSIVTYAGNARLLLPPSSGVEKELIQKEIENIEAEGSTQAVKGLKLALQTGNKQFIEGGNNLIILATDGAFDIGKRNKSLRRKIEKNAAKGLNTWVLGIKNEKWTKKSLKEIAELGNGSLIRCKNKGDTKKVLEEVKKSALP